MCPMSKPGLDRAEQSGRLLPQGVAVENWSRAACQLHLHSSVLTEPWIQQGSTCELQATALLSHTLKCIHCSHCTTSTRMPGSLCLVNCWVGTSLPNKHLSLLLAWFTYPNFPFPDPEVLLWDPFHPFLPKDLREAQFRSSERLQ